MKNTAKRQWSQNLTLKEVLDICIDTSIRFRAKNVLSQEEANLYYCYVVDNFTLTDYMQNFSQLLKFTQKDSPLTDRTRDRVLRMLSVAVKAHFFLYNNNNNIRSLHEPFFYTIPDISYTNKLTYGLIYKLNNGKTIIVSQKDLKNISDYNYNIINSPNINNTNNITNIPNIPKKIIKKEQVLNIEIEFPTVVGSNNFKWFNFTKWNRLKTLLNDLITKENNIPNNNNFNNILLNKIRTATTKEELIKYSDILDVPYDLKQQMADCGCIWNSNIKTWSLPKGHDFDNVNEYLNVLKKKFNL